MSDFAIRPYAYTEEDAAKLAVMWNESDDQWPGTFTGGVPMNTERVRDWMDRETGLAILVVDDPAQKRIVGYGSLWEELGREKECYVAVLNVHPAYQRKSLARRMLTQMVDQAVELGYRLMTIGTWPSNLKSVPLYKKVGFFWAPDTSVFMENFVPLIRQIPLAQRYFQRHDWYTTFRRELLQIEDDERHGAMKVYRYHWEEDGESLSVLIDREAKAVTGLETNDVAAYAELDEIEPAHGLPYPIRWRVTNKRTELVNVSILASGDPGVQISHQSAFVLEGGQERTVEGRFAVAPDIKPVKKERPAPQIKTVLVVGGEVLELGSGVRPRPAIKISTQPAYPVLLPGQAGTVHVQLHNHLDRPLTGVVSLAPEAGLGADWQGLRQAFKLGASGYAGLPLTVTCDNAGAMPLRFSTSFEVDGEHVHNRQERVPLFCLPPGGVVADIGESGDEGKVIVVENEFFRLRCRSEGGRCAVWDKFNDRAAFSIREELGPPFVPSELWFKQYNLFLEHSDGQVKALLHAQSNKFAGLAFTKELTVSASALMTLRYRLANEGSQTHIVQLNPRFWLGERQRARLTLPRAERMVRERAALFSNIHGDVPEKPAGMAERWLAWQADDLTLGLVWGDDVEKHEWDWEMVSFDRLPITLEPGTTTQMAPIYIYAGPGDWAEVRRIWVRMMGQSPPHTQPRPGRKLEFGFDPSPVITLSDRAEVMLRADNVRELPIDGRIVVEPPEGWRADPTEFTLNELNHERPLVAPVRLDTTTAGVGAYTGQLYLKSNRFDAAEPFSLLRLGDAAARIRSEEMAENDQTLFLVDNGRSRWQVAPGYHAGVVSWCDGDSDVNHLLCAFPREGGAELGWLKPWFGGIQPMLMPDRPEEEGWPGKLQEEQFTPQPVERTDARGLKWSGLFLSAQLKREAFQGLRAEIEYLTLGRSNLLKVVYRLVNETEIYWRVTPGLLTFCQADGRYDNSTMHADGVQLKRTPDMTWVVVGAWGAATNPESGRTLVVVKGTPEAWLELSDWGKDGGHVFGFRKGLIPPQSHTEMVVFLALTDSLEEAQRYAALAGLGQI
jgi:ribosomal protein S18 acetylase RimI-like enzyme